MNDLEDKNNQNVLASPKARKFARELGVDVRDVVGSERLGRVIEEDIKEFVSSKFNKKENIKINKEYEHSEFGKIEIKEIPRIKRIAAPHLVNSWKNIPHVTNHDEADITEMEEFRSSLKDIYTGEKKKITPLAFIIKAVVSSLRKFPSFNSSIDDIENGKITLKKYYHIGIAVDTPNGLVVPVVRNVQEKDCVQLTRDLMELSGKAREGKLTKDEMSGGTFTISSLGGLGGTQFTPIINAPEVGILGLSRSEQKPVWSGDAFQPRLMLPLSLSYDHRVIDGAEGAVSYTHLTLPTKRIV